MTPADFERLRTELFRRHQNAENDARDRTLASSRRTRASIRAETLVEVIALLNGAERGEPFD